MFLTAGLLALAVFTPARAADDDLRLTLPGAADAADAPTRTLGATNDDLTADTFETRYYGGGGYRGGYGGYRGYGGGYRGGYYGGYRGGYYGGYRGGYYGYGRGYYGGYGRGLYIGGFGRGYGYGGYGYGGYGYGYGGYAPVYSYYSYPVYPSYSYYYSPCAVVASSVAPATTLDYSITPSTPTPSGPTLSTTPTTPTTPTLPTPGAGVAPPMPRADGTYPYNGGPAALVPMPKGEETMTLPRVPTPITDRIVSLEVEPKTGKFLYPAYGETPRRSGK